MTATRRTEDAQSVSVGDHEAPPELASGIVDHRQSLPRRQCGATVLGAPERCDDSAAEHAVALLRAPAKYPRTCVSAR
jgi:hypothetical protein